MNTNGPKTEPCLMCIPAKSHGQGLSPAEVPNGQEWNNFCMIGGNDAN